MSAFSGKLLPPFPADIPSRPPATLIAFCRYYTRGAWRGIILMSLLVALIAAIEVLLFGFLRNIIDWLASADRATFLEQERGVLILSGPIS